MLGTATSTGELQKRELVLIQDLHVIPANHSLKQCEIVVLSHGRWDPALENMPAFTHKGYTCAGQDVEPFPLIPGARWRRSFRGRHAAAVGKDTVVIMFEISCTCLCLYALVLCCCKKDFRVSRLCVSEQMVLVIFATLRLCS